MSRHQGCTILSKTTGGSSKVDWANIYFGLHELEFLNNSIFSERLYFYKRFVDDVFGIWIPHDDPTIDEQLWASFVSLVNNFHGMEWTFSRRSTRVEFMDLDIELSNGSVITRVYEKPLALYQYIPPHSAHPPGCRAGLVIGQVLRYYQLSTRESDAQDQMREFYKRLRARGHRREELLPLFRKGLHRARTFLELPPEERLTDSKERSRKHDSVFLILPYHPDDPLSYQSNSCGSRLLPNHMIDNHSMKFGVFKQTSLSGSTDLSLDIHDIGTSAMFYHYDVSTGSRDLVCHLTTCMTGPFHSNSSISPLLVTLLVKYSMYLSKYQCQISVFAPKIKTQP